MAELTAIATTLKCLPLVLVARQITVFTGSQAALLAVSQSEKASIGQVYDAVRALRKRANPVLVSWVPTQGEFELGKKGKSLARQATEQGRLPQRQPYCAKSTTISIARATQREKRTLPEGIERYSTEMDAALPVKHTRTLYNAFKRREASVLAQLRTGVARLNGYLHRIGATKSDQCACGQAIETI